MIAFLANGTEATSREIERGSDLRQPEVSIALRTLRKNNWIEEKICRSDGTGRPMKVYRLKTPLKRSCSTTSRRSSTRPMRHCGPSRGLNPFSAIPDRSETDIEPLIFSYPLPSYKT